MILTLDSRLKLQLDYLNDTFDVKEIPVLSEVRQPEGA